MKVQGIIALAASGLSFVSAVAYGASGIHNMTFAVIFPTVSGAFALALFVSLGVRRRVGTASGVTGSAIGPHSSAHVPALMSGLYTTLSECPEEIRKVIEYPLINEILSAQSPTELADRVELAHGRLVKAEKTLASVRDRALLDCLIYLPLINAVARAVPAKTEEAAFAVMEKFSVVREASGRAASSARSIRAELEDTESERSIKKTADRSRKAVADEKESIRSLSQCIKENREQLAAMSREIEAGLDLLKGIADITERSKLIAFNMSIEAARIGEKGLGFKVIIAELHKLNDRTNEFSKRVSTLLSRFKNYTAILVENMEEKAGTVVAKVELEMEAASGAVDSLIGATDRSQGLAKEIALMSESIDRDLDGVLESLQFQDITRQMIEGSLAVLRELQRNVESCIAESGIEIDGMAKIDRFSVLRNRLMNDAKTKGEKNALMEVTL
jgi:hypothetical protein